jgi:hypothetical protein
MPNKLERLHSDGGNITITQYPATTALIPYGAVSGGILRIQLASPGATTVSWMVCDGPQDDGVALRENGNLVQTNIESNAAYPFPDACYAARYLRIISNTATISASYCVKG